jgi:pyridoxal phosphate-dependent aminotransferase EpsN|tara:strand:+ start:2603 stop:3694 length:1092 start_codon:yes stop_codon:yes gene_type:complete
MSGEEKIFFQEAFDSNWIAPLGPQVDAFEKEVADYVGIEHTLALSSGTAALHLALEVLGVSSGDIVFCSDLTFVASANVIRYQGATPVFIDCNMVSWTMCPKALQKAMDQEQKPKAVIVTDLYGQSADYEAIYKICNAFKIPVISDAAEAFGADYKGKKCGGIGDINILSFNGNKIITTSGGGMMLSNNEEWIQKARKLATQSRENAVHYEHKMVGYNYRLSNLLAAVGRGQLKVLDDRVEKRRIIFETYKNALSNIDGIDFMPEADYGMSNQWLTVCTVDPKKLGIDRNKIIHAMEKENIECRPIWKPMHLQPLFSGEKLYAIVETPNSDKLFRNGLCLPSGTNLSEEDQKKIINIIFTQLD